MATNSSEDHSIVEVVLEKQGKGNECPCGDLLIHIEGLGFSIRGGIDYIHAGDDPGIFVTSVKHEGAAARSGVIKPGDKILEVTAVAVIHTLPCV
jgi:S1-C subfamily serine protease